MLTTKKDCESEGTEHEVAAAGAETSKSRKEPSTKIVERMVKLSEIIVDAATHVREAVDDARVQKYARAMTKGARFPAIVLFEEHGIYYLADGTHRVLGRQKAGFTDVLAQVRAGGRSAAIDYALIVDRNKTRTFADRRKAVQVVLRDETLSREWSDGVIANKCEVSTFTVAKVAKELGLVRAERVCKNGKRMNTARIGRGSRGKTGESGRGVVAPKLLGEGQNAGLSEVDTSSNSKLTVPGNVTPSRALGAAETPLEPSTPVQPPGLPSVPTAPAFNTVTAEDHSCAVRVTAPTQSCTSLVESTALRAAAKAMIAYVQGRSFLSVSVDPARDLTLVSDLSATPRCDETFSAPTAIGATSLFQAQREAMFDVAGFVSEWAGIFETAHGRPLCDVLLGGERDTEVDSEYALPTGIDDSPTDRCLAYERFVDLAANEGTQMLMCVAAEDMVERFLLDHRDAWSALGKVLAKGAAVPWRLVASILEKFGVIRA
ncbi:MAG: ParB N-terminal domain-containing protein [Polyangiales bacterium]